MMETIMEELQFIETRGRSRRQGSKRPVELEFVATCIGRPRVGYQLEAAEMRKAAAHWASIYSDLLDGADLAPIDVRFKEILDQLRTLA
jgi:hypothetical protein